MLAVAIALGLVSQTPTPAQKLFDEVRAEIAAANTLSVREKMEEHGGDLRQGTSAEIRIRAKKPSLVRADVTVNGKNAGGLVSDGANTYMTQGNGYSRAAGGAEEFFERSAGIGIDAFFPGTTGEWTLLNSAPEAAQFKGRSVMQLNVRHPVGELVATYNFFVDAQSKLPVGFEQKYASAPYVYTVEYTDLQLGVPLDSELFAFHPGPDMHEMSASGGMDANLLAVNSAAPAFTALTAFGDSVSLTSALRGHKA